MHTDVNQIDLLVFHLDAAVVLQLIEAECPRLQMLILSNNGLNGVAMSYLAQGKRPLLETRKHRVTVQQ